jgi:CheY-like chemotaxis protein
MKASSDCPGRTEREKRDDRTGAKPRRIRVVIVDDSPFVVKSVELFFKRQESFEVVGIASNGVEAVQRVTEQRPDLVVMDVRMPEMDGLEATRRIKGQNDSPVVIIVTQEDGRGLGPRLKLPGLMILWRKHGGWRACSVPRSGVLFGSEPDGSEPGLETMRGAVKESVEVGEEDRLRRDRDKAGCEMEVGAIRADKGDGENRRRCTTRRGGGRAGWQRCVGGSRVTWVVALVVMLHVAVLSIVFGPRHIGYMLSATLSGTLIWGGVFLLDDRRLKDGLCRGRRPRPRRATRDASGLQESFGGVLVAAGAVRGAAVPHWVQPAAMQG